MSVNASKHELIQLIYRHLKEHGYRSAADELQRHSPQVNIVHHTHTHTRINCNCYNVSNAAPALCNKPPLLTPHEIPQKNIFLSVLN